MDMAGKGGEKIIIKTRFSLGPLMAFEKKLMGNLRYKRLDINWQLYTIKSLKLNMVKKEFLCK